jgi:hypothetical protein
VGGSWNEGTWNSYANESSSIAAIIAYWNGDFRPRKMRALRWNSEYSGVPWSV